MYPLQVYIRLQHLLHGLRFARARHKSGRIIGHSDHVGPSTHCRPTLPHPDILLVNTIGRYVCQRHRVYASVLHERASVLESTTLVIPCRVSSTKLRFTSGRSTLLDLPPPYSARVINTSIADLFPFPRPFHFEWDRNLSNLCEIFDVRTLACLLRY